MPRAASSVGIRRRVKRETALVSYNDLKARHSADGIILLVGLRSYDAHLSVTFVSDMQEFGRILTSRECNRRNILPVNWLARHYMSYKNT